MADTIWVYAEISDDRITTTSLEMLAKASEVGKALGYAYPQAVDEQMRAYLEAVRNLPVDARDERRTTKDDR